MTSPNHKFQPEFEFTRLWLERLPRVNLDNIGKYIYFEIIIHVELISILTIQYIHYGLLHSLPNLLGSSQFQIIA